MKLNLFKSLWGVVTADGGRSSLKQAVLRLKEQGYAGVECSVKLAHALNKQGQFTGLLKELGLSWIPIIYSSGPVNGWDPFLPSLDLLPIKHSDPVRHHLEGLQQQICDAQIIAGTGTPIPFFNAHSGHDSFEHGQSVQLMEACAALEASQGLTMVHEIHRGRICYSPWVVQRLLRDVPIKLVADYSHFMCVCEASPDDELLSASISSMATHIHHIHGRIGYENGPQVNDPRGPEWAQYVDVYVHWWEQIWTTQHRQHRASSTSLTPEFGPPPYQQELPSTYQTSTGPVADIAQVNDWLAALVRQRFRAWEASQRSPPGSGPMIGPVTVHTA
ncbi:hypothetical protein WJX72_008314 [[Myrmecia] bisecta]|uniref:Xylose isomerase n=1 Tax=[Myrmecia] bisecta TaxID=41462 RepID=A0AAW1Q891_9CHLO